MREVFNVFEILSDTNKCYYLYQPVHKNIERTIDKTFNLTELFIYRPYNLVIADGMNGALRLSRSIGIMDFINVLDSINDITL